MSDTPPSATQDKFIIRLPHGMRDRIKAAAEKNNRSMNAEIVDTLDEKYPSPSKLAEMNINGMFQYMARARSHSDKMARLEEMNRLLADLHPQLEGRFEETDSGNIRLQIGQAPEPSE